ncbi:MAG: hypothetical protein M1819_006843 [Sarea resinae]|nr:MAG: hypothetical protein M1819_006843 [Sarea resinae]
MFNRTLFRTLLPLSFIYPFTLSAPTSKRSVNGPAINANFPDPSILQVGSTWYAFGTNSNGINVQIATSEDFKTWTVLKGQDALPKTGEWSNGYNVWAPDVIQLSDDSFVLYYTAGSTQNPGLHCVGAATASTPTGPYTPASASLACPLSQGGAIDPAPFRDADDTLYVVYKIDGNSIGHGGLCSNTIEPIVSTPLMLQPLSADGVTPNGPAVEILDRGAADGPLVEAPSLIRTASGNYVLFFSSSCFATSFYDVSFAVSTNGIYGPYVKSSSPLLLTGMFGLNGPGGATAWTDGSHFVFHANLEGPGGPRGMWTGEIDVQGANVFI